jgi:cobalt-zinc-cadmium efflux system outer membrane protein
MVRTLIFLSFNLLLLLDIRAQVDSIVIPHSQVEDLEFLVFEVLANNPDVQAATYQMEIMEGKAQQTGTLDDPELRYRRDEMPDFRWREPMFHRIELMQMLRFPTKLSAESKIGNIQAEHAHHDHLEKVNEVLAKMKSTYYELWFVQQSIALTQENVRLMRKFARTAETKYAVGEISQQDALKARVELAKLENEMVKLRQQELATKAMLMAILNRAAGDTVGFAVISEEVVFKPTLETLQGIALQTRPMLKHDSLGIDESRSMLSLAQQEYLPDFRFGVEYMRGPLPGTPAWTVTAGVTLPFVPWTLGKAGGRVQEAQASVQRSMAMYNASKNMVVSNVTALYHTVIAGKKQLETYRTKILPQAQQSLDASMTVYQTGKTDFLMLLDAYRTLVDLRMEYFMLRMQFEQSIAELEQAVGYQGVATLE